MGIFDFLNSKKEKLYYAKVLNGTLPVFTSFGNNVYASDVVQQAVNKNINELKKLNPLRVRGRDTDLSPVYDELQRLLDRPNPIMTKSAFLEKMLWPLFTRYNSFVIPIYDLVKNDKTGKIRKKYRALYPIAPETVTFLQDKQSNIYVRFDFTTKDVLELPYEDVIHLKTHYSVNPFMGGNETGNPDMQALLETLQINKDLMTNISAAMKSSYAINGVVKYKTIMDKNKQTENALKDFEKKVLKSKSGFLPMDLAAEFIPIKKDIKVVDDSTLKFIDSKILRHFGVPLKILTGEFDTKDYEAYYQGTLEPIVVSMSEEFTRVLLTDREKDLGNKIIFMPKELVFMSTEQTLKMIEILSPTGALSENEKRVAIGLMPLEELEGKRLSSLNWIDAKMANDYQLSKLSKMKKGEKNE